MGKDLPGKNLLNCPDVFADIGNVNLFDGQQMIHSEDLEKQPTELTYKDNYGVIRHHYLDTRMKASRHQAEFAIFCIENQSGVSNIMPVRDMGYLYSNYSEQIRWIQQRDRGKGDLHIQEGIGQNQKLVPVVSMVLYYGQEPWTGPERLSEMLELPEEWRGKLAPYIADHPVKVIYLAGQDKGTREKYRSDFRHIVDYLACMGDVEESRRYIQDTGRKICHPEEYLDMMAEFSSDRRFSEIKENVLKRLGEGEEEITMFSIAEELENIGKQKGIEQGAALRSREIICSMLDDDQPPELISKYTKEPLEYVYQVKREVQFVGEKTAYVADGGEEK